MTSAESPKKPSDWWAGQATLILRNACKQRGYSYLQLSRTLENVGVEIGPDELEARISRGRFSFRFALQCLAALGFSTGFWFALPGLEHAKKKGLLKSETAKPRGRHVRRAAKEE